VVFPNNIKRIGMATFSRCKLSTIIFEEGWEKLVIDNWAFSDVPIKGPVFFPKRLERIGFKAFLDCDDIDSINVPYDEFIFTNCSKLSSR